MVVCLFAGKNAVVSATPVTVVEGLNTNVNIQCDLDLVVDTNALYWSINGSVYDLYNLPKEFEVTGNKAIILPHPDRNNDHWIFQCFTLASTDRTGLITELIVVYGEYS